MSNSKANIESEADLVLRPLMDHFESSLSIYADICEKTVLKRILKELWKITMYTFEKQVVLPPVSDPSALFLNLSIPSNATAKLTSVSQTLLSNVSSTLPNNKLLQVRFFPLKISLLLGNVKREFQCNNAKPDPTSLSDFGYCIGCHQKLLPCWWQRFEKQLSGKIARISVSSTRPLLVHPINGCVD